MTKQIIELVDINEPSQILGVPTVEFDRELQNGRKNIPISRIFNISIEAEVAACVKFCEQVEIDPMTIWWKIREVGDKVYVVGQKRRYDA
jgi:hypothetical protein